MPDPCDSLSDDDLLLSIQAGDPAARDLLASRFGPRLLNVARRRCRALQISLDHDEDIVQGVYQRVLDPQTSRFDPQRCRARQWLAGLAYNEAKSWMVLYHNRPTPETEEQPVEMDEREHPRWSAAFADIVTRDVFRAVLKNESARVGRVIMAHYFGDVELQALAHEEGISTFKMSRELRGFYRRAALLPHVFAT